MLALVSLVAGGYTALMQNFNNVILTERYSFSSEQIASVLTIGGILGWVGSLFVPWTSQRIGEIRGYSLVTGLQGVVLLYLGLAASAATFLPGFWVRTILGNMQMPLFSAFAMGVTAEAERATANSYAMVGRHLGAAIAAQWFGNTLATESYLLTFSSAGALAAITAAITLLAFRSSSSATVD